MCAKLQAAAMAVEEEMAAVQPSPGLGPAENKGSLGADGALGVGAVEEKGRDGLCFLCMHYPEVLISFG